MAVGSLFQAAVPCMDRTFWLNEVRLRSTVSSKGRSSADATDSLSFNELSQGRWAKTIQQFKNNTVLFKSFEIVKI